MKTEPMTERELVERLRAHIAAAEHDHGSKADQYVSDASVGEIRQAAEALTRQAEDNERLRKALKEYLGEFDTPVPDLAYRASLRDKLRKLIALSPASEQEVK